MRVPSSAALFNGRLMIHHARSFGGASR